MRFFYTSVCVLVLSLGLETTSLQAHHTVGNSRSMTPSFNPYSSQSRPPETFFDASLNLDHLDAGLGYVITYQFAGEYSLTRRISLGGRVPIVSVREKFIPDTDGLGDLAISLKGLVGEWPLHRIFLNLGTDISLPTGNENLLFSPYVTVSKGYRSFTLLFSFGSTLAAANSLRPSLDYGASIILPLVRGALPLDGGLSFQGSTAMSSKTFVNGSTKAYLKPAFIFHMTPKTRVTTGAKFSVLDTLAVKPGIALSRQSTAPLGDVDAGFFFDINYSF